MPSISGALGGAATGASIGSAAGPWGTAIGAGIGGIAGLFTGGKSKLQKQLETKIDPSLNNLIKWSGQGQDRQNQMFDLALPNLTAATNYYTGILNPDNPTALNAALGPQRTAVNDQFQGLLNQIGMFAPRGGGRNQQLANAGFTRNRQLMELIPQARAQAAAGALQTGSTTGNQAIQWGNLSTEQAHAVLQAITSMLTGQMADKARKDQGMAGVLAGLGPLLTDIMGQIKAGKGGGGGGILTGGVGGLGGIMDSPMPSSSGGGYA